MGADSFIKSQMHRMPTYDEVIYDAMHSKERINLPDRRATQLRMSHQLTRFDEVDETPDLATEQNKIAKERFMQAALQQIGGMGPDETASLKRAEAQSTHSSDHSEQRVVKKQTQGDIREHMQRGLDKAFGHKATYKGTKKTDAPSAPQQQRQTDIREYTTAKVAPPQTSRLTRIGGFMQRVASTVADWYPTIDGGREEREQYEEMMRRHQLNLDTMEHIKEMDRQKASEVYRASLGQLKANADARDRRAQMIADSSSSDPEAPAAVAKRKKAAARKKQEETPAAEWQPTGSSSTNPDALVRMMNEDTRRKAAATPAAEEQAAGTKRTKPDALQKMMNKNTKQKAASVARLLR